MSDNKFEWTDQKVNDFMHDVFAPCDPNHPFIKDKMRQFKEKINEVFYLKGTLVKDTWTDTFYNKDSDGWWKRDGDTAGYSIHNEEIGPGKRYELMPFGCTPTIIDIPKRDWQIQSFYYATQKNTLATRTLDGLFYIGMQYATEEEMLKSEWSIHSVKRVSDAQVFTISDIVDTDGYYCYPNKPIKKFFIQQWVMYIQWDEGKGINDGCMGLNAIKKAKSLLLTTEEGIKVYDPEQIIFIALGILGSLTGWDEKAKRCLSRKDAKYFHSKINRDQYIADNSPKIPLFTTEDGIEIFTQCNKLFIVHNMSLEISKGFVDFQFDQSKGMNYHYKPGFNKYFVSEQKAEEYILLNKLIQVSYKQLDDYIEMRIRQTPCPTKREIIKEFFKSKINS